MDVKKLDARSFGLEVEKYFRPQNPIEDVELLQGRSRQVKQVTRALTSTGRSVFVWGDRGVGKTSLAVASAQENLPPSLHPIQIGCDSRNSTMLGLVSSMVSELTTKDPLKAKSAEVSGSLNLFGVAGVTAKTSQSGWTLENADDAARALGAAVDRWRDSFRGYNPIIIIDEFDQLQPDERKYFGDLLKQVGDRRIKISMIFCGVSESFEDLLAGHESAYRYIEPVHLERLYLDAAMDVLRAGADGLGIAVHEDYRFRAAQISDGFPHFVHLIGSSMMWEYYDDPATSSGKIESRHFESGIARAVSSTEKRLEDLYNGATRKYTAGWDYVLWAAADHHQLIQSSNTIYDSYCRIVKDVMQRRAADPSLSLPEIVSSNEKTQDPFDRTRFNSKMNALKQERHRYVLKGTRAGWYQFKVPMLRGYCRLVAHRYGIRLGTDYPISKPYGD